MVFIYGIGPETTHEEVLNIFRGFGPILRTDVIKNKRTTIGKGEQRICPLTVTLASSEA